jgi:hypothetical protein
MKILSVILAPEKHSGFGNQIYTIAQSVQNCIENKICSYDLILFTSFLKEIHTNEYCNMSEIIDIKETNNILQKINAPYIEDYNLFNVTIIKAQIVNNNFLLDLTNIISGFLKNNKFLLTNTFNFAPFCETLIKDAYNKYFIQLDKNKFILTIDYKINNTILNKKYEICNGGLKETIKIDLNDCQLNVINICTNHDDNFYHVKKNISFNKKFAEKVNEYVNEYLTQYIQNGANTNKKINCIHLRLEDDIIEEWSKYYKVEKYTFKTIFENKYLREIKNYIKKEDLTIILSHNYDNNVIKYLKENSYNYLTTPTWSNYRDISAIYDCLACECCNNMYICLYESSFSYLLLYRLKKKLQDDSLKTCIVSFNDFNDEENLMLSCNAIN